MGECRDASVRETARIIQEHDRILILCHMKPDGDTLGSGFALLYALRTLNKTVRIACSDGFPPRYAFLYPDFDFAGQPNFPPEFIIAVDIADAQLLGESTGIYHDRIDLCIDHHPSNSRYATNLLLDTKAAATAQVVYTLLKEMEVSITPEIATCIYTGLTTDTGCFRYSNVTAQTHLLAAEMIALGVDHGHINKRMFETKSAERLALERMVMDTLEYYYGGRFAMIVISEKNVRETGVPEEDLEGLSAIPRQIEGVEVSVTLRQKDKRKFRASMRSGKRIDVSKVCARMGGGGHARAAGCMLEGTLDEVKELLINQLAPEFALQTAPGAKKTI